MANLRSRVKLLCINHIKVYMTKLLVILTLLISCKAVKQPQALTSDNQPYVLKYQRGPCFGRCPAYTFYLLEDHTALLHARTNWPDSAGWYSGNVDQESVVAILELIEDPEWWSPDYRDQPEIADLPVLSLAYHHPNGLREINVQNRITPEIQNVLDQLNTLIESTTWNGTVFRPREEMLQQLNVIVQLKPEVDINAWMHKFDRFGISLIRRLSPNQDYYLFSKNPELGTPNDFLQHIKSDTDVIDAQWDRSTEVRDQ